jgi:hypothetical protein
MHQLSRLRGSPALPAGVGSKIENGRKKVVNVPEYHPAMREYGFEVVAKTPGYCRCGISARSRGKTDGIFWHFSLPGAVQDN